MQFNFTRRLPLSMLCGLTIAGVGIAAPVDQHGSADERLILIAESALHGVAVTDSDSGADMQVPRLTQSGSVGGPDQNAETLRSSPSGSGLAMADGTTPGVDKDINDRNRQTDHLQKWAAVPANQLDDMRGGFDTSLNLTLSFGIERAVYLNGALVTTTSFNLPALGTLPHDDANGAIVPNSSVALVQNGPGNTFIQGRDPAPLAATVIQNTLSNQALQNLTTINASSNSLQILRTNAFQSMLQDGIGHVVVPH